MIEEGEYYIYCLSITVSQKICQWILKRISILRIYILVVNQTESNIEKS